jgi:hypothetical protein
MSSHRLDLTTIGFPRNPGAFHFGAPLVAPELPGGGEGLIGFTSSRKTHDQGVSVT